MLTALSQFRCLTTILNNGLIIKLRDRLIIELNRQPSRVQRTFRLPTVSRGVIHFVQFRGMNYPSDWLNQTRQTSWLARARQSSVPKDWAISFSLSLFGATQRGYSTLLEGDPDAAAVCSPWNGSGGRALACVPPSVMPHRWCS